MVVWTLQWHLTKTDGDAAATTRLALAVVLERSHFHVLANRSCVVQDAEPHSFSLSFTGFAATAVAAVAPTAAAAAAAVAMSEVSAAFFTRRSLAARSWQVHVSAGGAREAASRSSSRSSSASTGLCVHGDGFQTMKQLRVPRPGVAVDV